MLRFVVTALFLVACSGGCGGTATTAEATSGPARLEPGLGDETEVAGSGGGGPTRVEEEAVDPPPVEPPPP